MAGECEPMSVLSTRSNPASLSHWEYSAKVKVSPSSLFTSMFRAKISGKGGPVRASFGIMSRMTARIRAFFEAHGLLIREWDKVRADWLTIAPS